MTVSGNSRSERQLSLASEKRKQAERPEWWSHYIKPAITNGDIALIAATDLLIRDSERRCALLSNEGKATELDERTDASRPQKHSDALIWRIRRQRFCLKG